MGIAGGNLGGAGLFSRQKTAIAVRMLAFFILVVLACTGCGQARLSDSTPTPEPLVPTPPTKTLESKEVTALSSPTADASSLPEIHNVERERFGVGVASGSISDYPVDRLGIGWYLNWQVEVDPAHPDGAAFWQMVRVSEEGYRPDETTIQSAALANPGSIWLIGNEPDVTWQDNTTPKRYAELYHELYYLLKTADPSCRVAIGGVSQPTPLRLSYLDRILEAYQARYGEPIPVDVWNVHGFVLREEVDSWGVRIPPGIEADTGVLYEIEDHDDIGAFQGQILAFRRWMAERGYRDRPLVVSEYGILMPSDYGFEEERVQAFMEASFDYFLTATDDAVGYPADGNRLVQWWCWYSLADTVYSTGNLFDPTTKTLTYLGDAFARYSLQGSGSP